MLNFYFKLWFSQLSGNGLKDCTILSGYYISYIRATKKVSTILCPEQIFAFLYDVYIRSVVLGVSKKSLSSKYGGALISSRVIYQTPNILSYFNCKLRRKMSVEIIEQDKFIKQVFLSTEFQKISYTLLMF